MTRIDFPEREIECIKVIEKLIGKEEILNQIKESNEDVEFWLEIVSTIYEGEAPIITFGNKVLKFCSLTGTDIDIDTYVYPFGGNEVELD